MWQAVALAGLAVAVVPMFFPVSAAFGDDPLLRLQGFGRQAGPVPTSTDCGSALSNVGEPRGGGTLYQVARDDACREVAERRVALAFAGGLFVFMLGAAGAVAAERRTDRRSLPPAAPPSDSSAGEGDSVERSGDAPPAQ